MSAEPFIKVCGVRERTVFEAAVRSGARAVGLNFVEKSRRSLTREEARALLEWARDRFERLPVLVGVFVDAEPDRMRDLRSDLGLDLVQLHGRESPDRVAEMRPAIKAIRLGSPEDLDDLRRFPGGLLLVDARVPGRAGGTGRRIPTELARAAAKIRPVVLAGGLHARNVGSAIAAVQPAGVDTASGTEDASGRPSAEAARDFVEAAVAAYRALANSVLDD